MQKLIIKILLATIACFGHIKLFAAFINYLDIDLENESSYQINNIESANNEKGMLLSLYTDKLAPGANAEVANLRANFLGQLSQDLKFDLYKNGNKAGRCNLHIGLGSYLAKPDFTGSECQLLNGELVQFSPRYDVINNTYKTIYKLSNERNFSRIILFGDSMSDNGNLYARTVELSMLFYMSPVVPISPPYFKGRFTNGKVWVEHLAQKLNIPENSLINYAYAGASVEKDHYPIPTLDKQVNTYLTWNRTGDPYALYVVWIGGNDFIRHLSKTDDDLIASVLNGIEKNIRKLLDHGARTILSPQLPDIAAAPDSLQKNIKYGNTEYTDRLDLLVSKYNQYHRSMLSRLSEEFKDVQFITYDVYKFIQDTRDNARELGFYNIDERCNPNSYWDDSQDICQKPKEYVFWDGVHPSAKAHKILSELMYEAVTEGGYKPNASNFRTKAMPDDVVERNKEAIQRLNKDLDTSVKDKTLSSDFIGGLRSESRFESEAESMEIIIKENLPLL